MIFAALLSALALAGAPADTPVSCSSTVFSGSEWGFAYPSHVVPGGAPQPLTNISLYGPVGCAATLIASETPKQRNDTARLNRGVNLPEVTGEGLLLVLHEAVHVGRNSRDECGVERAAWALYPSLSTKFLTLAFAAQAMSYASAYNVFILAFYKCV